MIAEIVHRLLPKSNAKNGESLPSVLRDPFNMGGFDGMMISVKRDMFNPNQFTFRANVEFKNGNTNGEQVFTGRDFEDLMAQLEAFFKEMKTKGGL